MTSFGLGKKFGFSCFAVILLIVNLLLAACGDSTPTGLAVTNNTTTTSATSTAPVTITWSFWGDEDEIAINNKLIEQFEKFHPDIKVKTLSDTWENYYNRLENDWTGSNSPDVMFLENITTYASMGRLLSLEPFLAASKDLNLEDFYSGLLDISRYKGALYGLPRDNDTKVVFVNLKLLDEAGIQLPKAGWTWQDLQNAAIKLTKRDANGNVTQYGYAFEPNDWWRLWIWQNGGEIFDNYTPPEPPAHLLVNTPENAAAIQFFADLINVYKVSPPYDQEENSGEISTLFKTGKAAMVFGNHALVPGFSNTKDLKWDIVPLPMGKKRVNIMDGAGYVINANTKQRAASWELVKFLSSELGQGFFMESGVVVPARKSIREENIYVRDSRYNWQVFVEETKVGRTTPQFRGFNKISKLVDQELQPVWKGTKTASEVLATLPSKIDPELARLRP